MAIYCVYLGALFHCIPAVGLVTEFITTLEEEVIFTADLATIKIIQTPQPPPPHPDCSHSLYNTFYIKFGLLTSVLTEDYYNYISEHN